MGNNYIFSNCVCVVVVLVIHLFMYLFLLIRIRNKSSSVPVDINTIGCRLSSQEVKRLRARPKVLVSIPACRVVDAYCWDSHDRTKQLSIASRFSVVNKHLVCDLKWENCVFPKSAWLYFPNVNPINQNIVCIRGWKLSNISLLVGNCSYKNNLRK